MTAICLNDKIYLSVLIANANQQPWQRASMPELSRTVLRESRPDGSTLSKMRS
jgi:hypothetical protein